MAPVPKAYKKIVFGLNSVLANEFSLFTKTLNYHWNITGPRFSSLHVFLGEQYNELLLMMDEVAERVRVLDERPVSTIKGMYSSMEIKDGEVKTPSKGNWKQIKGQLKEKWGKLTDDELTQAEGRTDFLAGKVQERYGQAKDEALKEVNEFFKELK